MKADILHRIMGILGGKKFLALIAGIVIWCLDHWHVVNKDQLAAILKDGQDLSTQAQGQSSVLGLLGLITGYIGVQGLLDIFTNGATSSVALITETGAHAPEGDDKKE